MSWIYNSANGQLFHNGELVTTAYSGFSVGQNNPAMESVENVGPIPRGFWNIQPAYEHPVLGPLTMNLEPQPETDTFNRSAFRIHGDDAAHLGESSHGCIVANHTTRLPISQSTDKVLQIV
jgi:Protein of unknown function (DUF2778)